MGGTYIRKTPKSSDKERFMRNTVQDTSGCLIWTGGLYDKVEGYGGFTIGGKHMRAHRAAWLLEYGELLSSHQHLLHSCDNRLCVEVLHLRVGTPAMNSSDKESRKRGNHTRGMTNALAKYSDQTVQDVLRWHNEGASVKVIMDRLGCSRRWVDRVITGQIRSQPSSPPSPVAAERAAGRARAKERRETLADHSVCIIHPDDVLDGEEEEWRPTDYNGYFVSSLGRVRGRHGRVLKLILKETGSGAYWVVACGRDNQKAVHTLVCTAWHGEQPPGKEVAHIDGDPDNNSPSNLRWATRAENMADKVLHGRASGGSMPGESHPNSKLTWDMAREIRAIPIDGPRGSLKLIAAKYGVSRTTIRYIQLGRSWVEPAVSRNKTGPAEAGTDSHTSGSDGGAA